jgi:hypothetical protein
VRDADEARLIEKLGKIEALFARAASDGERAAAGSAIDRIRERLREVEKREKAIEFRFSLGDAWSKRLFLALLRRYGIEPYRYRGQRRTTVVARVAPSFCREVLWPEFEQLNATLREHLESVTKRVVAEAIHRNVSEPEERPERERESDGPIALLGGE